MRSLILMGCLWLLSPATNAQTTHSRVPSGTPLKWSMQGGIEIMPGDLSTYYGTGDTATAFRRNISSPTAVGGNPNATRFASLNAQCHQNTVAFNWVAIQQFNAYNYEIEQSSNGRNWEVVGVVPAKRTEFGESSYNFNYNRNVGNVFFRITATDIAGQRVFSSVLESPCSNNSYIGLTPNPVYSSTTIRLGSPANAKVRLILMDAKGAVVHTTDANLMQGINHIPLDMSRFSRGSYTVVIRWFNGKQEVLPVVKH